MPLPSSLTPASPGTPSKFSKSKRLPSSPKPSRQSHQANTPSVTTTSHSDSGLESERSLINTMASLGAHYHSSILPNHKPPEPPLPDSSHDSPSIYMYVAASEGVEIYTEPSRSSPVIFSIPKASIVACQSRKTILQVPWYTISLGDHPDSSEGYICGSVPSTQPSIILNDQKQVDETTVPTLLTTDVHNFTKKRDLENLECRTLAAQIVRLLIQCYGLTDARRVATDAYNIAANADPFQPYKLLETPYSHSAEQDPLAADGTPKKLTAFDIIPIMTKRTRTHSHPHSSIITLAKYTQDIANMRPSEWGYQEWGYEGEHGHRVLILDDLTKQQKLNDFIADAASNRIDTVKHTLTLPNFYIDGMHTNMHYTALHAAADFGHNDMVKLLIESGFHKFIDVLDRRYNQTALHYASMNGRMDVVLTLLEHGADRHALNCNNFMPRDIAMIWHQYDVAVVLKEPPGEVTGLRVVQASAKMVKVAWDEPFIDDKVQAPIQFYELMHRMRSSEQTHIDNSTLTLEWTKLPLIDYESTVNKRGQGTTHTFTALLPASGHEFNIRCRNCCGWGPLNERALLQYTPGCEPTPPSKIHLVKTTRTSIMVEWHPPVHKNGASISGYEICYRRVGDDPMEDPTAHLRFIFQEMDKDGSGTVERPEFVKALKTFGFKLTAIQMKRLCDALDHDRDGHLDFSEFVAFCEKEDIEDDDADKVALAAALSANLTEKQRQRDEENKEIAALLKLELKRITMGSQKPKTKWETVSFHALQYCAKSFEKLVVFGKYEFMIRCKNSYGYSAYSEISGPFKLIEGLWTTDVTARSVSLEWQKLIEIFPVVAYELQVREIIGKGAHAASEKDYITVSDKLQEQKHTVVDLKPNTAYNFRVRPCVKTAAFLNRDAVHGEWRPWIFGIATDLVVTLSAKPEPVGRVRCFDEEDAVTHSSLEVSWVLGRDNGSRIVESEIMVKEDLLEYLPHTISVPGAIQSQKIENLEPGRGYQFKVRARNEHGWTDWSELSDVRETRGAFPPSKPEVVKENHGRRGVVAADSSWIMMQWGPPADNSLGCPETYELQLCNVNPTEDNVWETCAMIHCTGTDVGVPSPDDCKYFVTNLKAAVNYIFRVRCCTALGWSVWSEESDEIVTLGRF